MHRARSIPSSAFRCAFTLLELLVVIGIISLLLVAVIPAVNSLSKSSGRKVGASNLLGMIEQARSQAIKDGLPTYVVFSAFGASAAPPQAVLDRYNYKSYAIFEDDPANPATQKQLTQWRTLPTGISFRSKKDVAGNTDKYGALDTLPRQNFAFQPTSTSETFPFIKFNANGEIESPTSDVVFVLFEGFAKAGSENIIGARDSFNNPLTAEALKVSRLTGRAEPTVTPTPSS